MPRTLTLAVALCLAVVATAVTAGRFWPRPAHSTATVTRPSGGELGAASPWLPPIWTPPAALPGDPLTVRPDLARDLSAILGARNVRPTQWGVLARNLATGETMFSLTGATTRMPASNLKLVTTAAALSLLGPEFAYRTTISRDGDVTSDSLLRGDLWVRPTGDPLFSARFTRAPSATFEQWADSLRSRGIRRVAGDLVIDTSYFAGASTGQGWDLSRYYSSWYAAESATFSYNDNCVVVAVRPGLKVGDPVRVRFEPETSFLTVVNSAKTVKTRTVIKRWGRGRKRRTSRRQVGGGAPLIIRRLPGTNTISITGTASITRGEGRVLVTVAQPNGYAALALRDALARRGVTVAGQVKLSGSPAPKSAVPMIEHRSLPLREIIKVINQRSQNLFTENLIRTLAHEATGVGSPDSGRVVVTRFVSHHLSLEPNAFYLADGCGLSRLDRVSPELIVRLLTVMQGSPAYSAYFESLAVPGSSGTLGYRLVGDPERWRVHGKTGTIDGVSALSGYITSPTGDLVAFSILGNSGSGALHSAQDAVVSRLMREPLIPGGALLAPTAVLQPDSLIQPTGQPTLPEGDESTDTPIPSDDDDN